MTLAGRIVGAPGTAYTFTATVTPPDTILALTHAWEATGPEPVSRAAVQALSDSPSFAWPVGGP